jgi:hypothetical protein
MAEIVQVSGKGKRKGSAASGVGGAGKTAGLAELAELNTAKPRERRAKGYGVDRLRTAVERRMAGSSEALAESLMSKAIAGRLESVKILMKLAEEEKARREEEREEDVPRLSELLVGSVVKVGQMWDGHRWRRVAKSRILEEGCAKWDDLVGTHKDPERDVLEEAA